MNDPLLQTLLEADRILSRSKQGLVSSNSQDKPKDNTSQHSLKINDDSKESSLDREEPSKSSVADSSPAYRESGVSSLPANIAPIDEKEILQNRLSLEQIKEIPKFTGYNPGEPNKVSLHWRRRGIECPFSPQVRLWYFIAFKKIYRYMSGFLKMVLKNCTPELYFTKLSILL